MKENLNFQFLGNTIVVSQLLLCLELIFFSLENLNSHIPNQDLAFLMAPSW